jgi:hypothetical protein
MPIFGLKSLHGIRAKVCGGSHIFLDILQFFSLQNPWWYFKFGHGICFPYLLQFII